MDLEEYEHAYDLARQSVSERRRSRAYSFDSGSVKEMDTVSDFQQYRRSSVDHLHTEDKHATEAQLQNFQVETAKDDDGDALDPQDSSELEDLLQAGREELLRTSTLSLRHLSSEKIVSLMQLILDSSGDSPSSPENTPKAQRKTLSYSKGNCSPQVSISFRRKSTPPGLRIFQKLLSRVRAFVSAKLATTPRSQLLRAFTVGKATARCSPAMLMSEAVAKVLEGRYLPELQQLSLPPCEVPTILKAIISGRVSTLQHLELQGQLHAWRYSNGKLLKRLFMSGLVDRLHRLHLSRCGEAEVVDALCVALETGRIPILITLDLSFDAIQGDAGSRSLSRLLRCRALVCLETLNLESCGISDEGVGALAEALQARGRWKLKCLNLSSNDIGDEGFAALLIGLKADRLPQLQELHLLYNYRIGEECKVEAANILEGGHLPRLQAFYLPSHSITEKVAEAFLAAYKHNVGLTVELLGIWWPNEGLEREAADCRERNLRTLNSSRKTLASEFQSAAKH